MERRRFPFAGFALLSVVFVGGAAPALADYSFMTLGPQTNAATGINNAGEIVGNFVSGGGFLYAGGNFSPIDVPGSSNTQAFGINNSGQIVGFTVIQPLGHGFLDSGGSYTLVDDPAGRNGNTATGINDRRQSQRRRRRSGPSEGSHQLGEVWP